MLIVKLVATVISSAKRTTSIEPRSISRSITCSRINSGPNTEPCGTPHVLKKSFSNQSWSLHIAAYQVNSFSNILRKHLRILPVQFCNQNVMVNASFKSTLHEYPASCLSLTLRIKLLKSFR